jgi:hypothetical protein
VSFQTAPTTFHRIVLAVVALEAIRDEVDTRARVGDYSAAGDFLLAGGWPEQAVRGSRVLGFDSQLRPLFTVGRQSKDPREANTGRLFYPMQTEAGPSNTVVVNDQTRQSPHVFTRDGRVLWLSPGIGHNRLYEITDWNGWKSQRGDLRRPADFD